MKQILKRKTVRAMENDLIRFPFRRISSNSGTQKVFVSGMILSHYGLPSKKVSAQFGVQLSEDFVNVPEYEQLTLGGLVEKR